MVEEQTWIHLYPFDWFWNVAKYLVNYKTFFFVIGKWSRGCFGQKKKKKELFNHQLTTPHILKTISKSIKRCIIFFSIKSTLLGKAAQPNCQLIGCSGPSSWPVLFLSCLRSAPFRTRCSPREATGVAWPPTCRCSWWTQRPDSPGLLLSEYLRAPRPLTTRRGLVQTRVQKIKVLLKKICELTGKGKNSLSTVSYSIWVLVSDCCFPNEKL